MTRPLVLGIYFIAPLGQLSCVILMFIAPDDIL